MLTNLKKNFIGTVILAAAAILTMLSVVIQNDLEMPELQPEQQEEFRSFLNFKTNQRPFRPLPKGLSKRIDLDLDSVVRSSTSKAMLNTANASSGPAKRTRAQKEKNKFLKKKKGEILPSLLSLLGFKSLMLQGLQKPLEFAKSVYVQRMQEEIAFGVHLTHQKEVTEVFEPKLRQGDEAPVHTALKGPPNHEYRVGDVIPNEDARQIHIATTWRSGSSFLGQLLSQYPGAFYNFEPLHYFEHSTIKPSYDPLQLNHEIYKCNFNNISDFMLHVSKFSTLLVHNTRVSNVCTNILSNKRACYMPQLIKDFCQVSPIRITKTVRLRVSELEMFLTDPEMPNFKVIHLVRDPRGVMMSRSQLDWCKRDACHDLKTVCDHLDADYEAALDLRARYPGRVHLVRYEDLSIDTIKVTDEILKFLELPPSDALYDFIERRTHKSSEKKIVQKGAKKKVKLDPYSTFRDSKKNAFVWRDKMEFSYVKAVQDHCQAPMRKLGYNLVENQEDLHNHSFPLINKSKEEIW